MMAEHTADDPRQVVHSILQATNAHDLDALTDCFAADYRNDTPAHPARSFSGADQVRRNWQQILGGIPDMRVELLRCATEGDTVWSELEMRGTRPDNSVLLTRGVVIFGVAHGKAKWAKFYMEPVEEGGGDVNEAVSKSVNSRHGAAK